MNPSCHDVQSHPKHIIHFLFTCFVLYFALSILRCRNIFIKFFAFSFVKCIIFLYANFPFFIFKHKFNFSLLRFQTNQQQKCNVAITADSLLSVLLDFETSFLNKATLCLYCLAPLSLRVSCPGNTFRRF